MTSFRPFAAIRPRADVAKKVSCLPYDVMNRKEAVEMAKGNDISFLHVIRSEIDFGDEIYAHNKIVYEKAYDNLVKFQKDGILLKDEKPNYYIYRLTMDGRSQTGIVGCAAIDDYIENRIKKHELTRLEKELDRIDHSYHCNANTEPVFMIYRSNSRINEIVEDWVKNNEPVYKFDSDSRFGHEVWTVDEEPVIREISSCFAKVDSMYIADGHHRSASGAKVGQMKREESAFLTGDEEFNYFLGVSFPDDQLYIMDYNRVVKDLFGNSEETFLQKVQEKFKLEEVGEKQHKPEAAHIFGMYLDGKWYKLTAKSGTFDESDPIGSLDCEILQRNLLNPVLGIKDARSDERIDFVGGIRGLEGLEKRVDSGEMKVAFAVFPVSIKELISVADSGQIMPPKSTWFEPKLRSGLFVHEF